MTRPLTPNLTSYDFLKTAALVLMVVDHVGVFFYPDDMWLRAVGRLSAPIWMFLIGYAVSRDFSARMWIAIGFMTLSSWVLGVSLLPLPILATMLVFRALIDPVMALVRRRPESLYPITFIAFVLTIPSAPVLEYGSNLFLMVMLGYITRHRDTLWLNRGQYVTFAYVATLAHVFYQLFVYFSFTTPQMLLSGAGMLGVTFIVLVNFRGYEYPRLTAALPAPVVALLQLMGRRTLEFYALHFVAFKAVSLYLAHEIEPFRLVIWAP